MALQSEGTVYNREKLFSSTLIICTWLWFHCDHSAFLTNIQVKTRQRHQGQELSNKMCRWQNSLVCFIPSNCWHLDSLRLWCASLLFNSPERLNYLNHFLSNSPICIIASFQFHSCCVCLIAPWSAFTQIWTLWSIICDYTDLMYLLVFYHFSHKNLTANNLIISFFMITDIFCLFHPLTTHLKPLRLDTFTYHL